MAQQIQTLFIDDIDGGPAEGTVRFGLDGTDRVGITFLNDHYEGSSARDRNLYVDKVVLNGEANGKDHSFYSAGTEYWEF